MTPKENVKLLIKKIDVFLKEISSHELTQLNSEERLGNIVGLFSKLIDKEATRDFPELHTFLIETNHFAQQFDM